MKINYRTKNTGWHGFYYNQFSVGSTSEEYPLTIGGFTKDDYTDSSLVCRSPTEQDEVFYSR